MRRSSCRSEPDLPQPQLADRCSSSELAAVESDHRLANSLALVATLLKMQRERSSEPAVRDAILSAEARVASIANLHAYLHRHGARDRVDLADYLGEVLPEIGSGVGIRCFLEDKCAEPIEVEGRIATQLTIIVNELALNALKHGYGGADGGRVSFELDRYCDNGFRLIVNDGGLGLPDGFDLESGGGLGMKIVATTVSGLGGSFTAQTNDGARFTILIPRA